MARCGQLPAADPAVAEAVAAGVDEELDEVEEDSGLFEESLEPSPFDDAPAEEDEDAESLDRLSVR
jgi:hypothetical protein